jgi:small subunit ribosomal protein S16
MPLRIRLSRGGTKKRPYYRVVVADSRSPRDGRFIERIGSYDPMLKKEDPNRIIINEDRARHWLGFGAVPSDRVARFLGGMGVVPMPERHEQTKQNMPRPKTVERMREAEEAAKAAAEAAAAEAAAPVEEPVEEAAAEPAEEAAAEPAEEAAAEPAEEAPTEPAEETAAEPAEEADAKKEAPAAE